MPSPQKWTNIPWTVAGIHSLQQIYGFFRWKVVGICKHMMHSEAGNKYTISYLLKYSEYMENVKKRGCDIQLIHTIERGLKRAIKIGPKPMVSRFENGLKRGLNYNFNSRIYFL